MTVRSALVTSSLITAIVAIFCFSLWINRDSPHEEGFVGSDATATAQIEENHPDYQPWFASVFTPGSGEIESGLFALQAAAGAGIFGFAIGALWQRNRSSDRLASVRYRRPAS